MRGAEWPQNCRRQTGSYWSELRAHGFRFLLKPVRLDLLKRAVADAMKQAQFHESCLASPAAGTRQMLSAELEKYYPGITHLPPRDKDGYYLFGSDSGS